MTDALVLLEGLLEELPAAVETRRLGDALTRATTAIEQSGRQMDRIEAILKLAERLGYGASGDQQELILEFRAIVDSVGKMLATASSIEDLNAALYEFQNELKTTIVTLERDLMAHWRQVIVRDFEPMVAVGDLMGRIGNYADLGRRLSQCGRNAAAQAQTLGAIDLLSKVERLYADAEKLNTERRHALGEGDVAGFFNALAENKATLAIVTNEIRDWLVANQALEKMKVSFSGG